MSPDVEQVVAELKGRKLALELEIAAIDTTLRQLAGFLSTPTREEHAQARRKHTPIPLKATREEAGITQRDLAKTLGVSHSYLSQIESGSRRASTRVVERMEQTLQEMIAHKTSNNGGGKAA